MAQIIIENNFDKMSDESGDEIDINNNDILNYRGYFLENENEEDNSPKYFEHNAHFPYLFLYQKLEIISQQRKEEEEKENNKNNNNINDKKDKNDNKNDFQNIFNCFNPQNKK